MIDLDEQNQRITSVRGGGCLMLFGLAFAAGGGLFIWLLLTGGEVTVNGRPGQPGDAWMPGLFVVFGAIVAFGRRRLVVDLREAKVTRQIRWLGIPFYATSNDLEPPSTVALLKVVTRSDSGSNTSYRVKLRASSGVDLLELAKRSTLLEARRDAERVAKLAHVPLVDESEGAAVVRQPHELDHSVVDTETPGRARPTLPASSSIQATRDSSGATFRLPLVPHVLVLGILGAAVPTGALIGFWWFFWRNAHDESASSLADRGFELAPLVLAGVIAVQALFLAFRRGALGSRVVVDGEGLAAGGKRIPTAELEELRVVHVGRWAHLLARSDRNELRIGYGLAAADLGFLREAILHALRSHPRV